MLPLRAAPALAAAVKVTVPFPVPLPAEVTVIQGATAITSQVELAVTATLPVAPLTLAVCPGAARLHVPPQAPGVPGFHW